MRREAENRAEKFIKKRLLKKRLAGMLLVMSLIVGSVTMYMLKHSAVAVSDEAAEEVGMVMEGENDSDGGEEIVVEEMENDQAEENSAEETDGSESHGSEPEQNEAEESDENSVAEESSNEENKENSDETSGEEVTEGSNEESSEESVPTEEAQESSEVSLEAGAEKQLESSSGSNDTDESSVSNNTSEESEEKESTEDNEKQVVSDNEASGEGSSQEEDVEKTVSDNTASDEAASNDSDEKNAVSDNNTEKESASDNSVSNNDAAEDSASDNSVSNNRAADNGVSDNSVSDNSVSNNSVSGNSVSDDSVSKNAVKTEYVYEDDTIRVVATLEKADAVPDDAEFKVVPVTKENKDYSYDAYIDALNENSRHIAEESGESIPVIYDDDNTLLYDIAFIVNGVEYEPAEGSVSVAINFKNSQIKDGISADNANDVSVVHLTVSSDNTAAVNTTEVSSNEIDVTVLKDSEVKLGKEEDALTFETDSFSVYAALNVKSKSNGKYSAAEIVSMLGDMTYFGAVSRMYDGQNNHSEANIATKKISNIQNFTIGNSTNVYIYIKDFKVQVNKHVEGSPKKNTFYFAFYYDKNGWNKVSGSDFSITTSDSGYGSWSGDVKKYFNNGEHSQLYVYELNKKGGQPVMDGGNVGKYEVSYGNNSADGASDGLSYFSDNYVESIGSYNPADLLQKVDGVSLFWKNGNTYKGVQYTNSGYKWTDYNKAFPIDVNSWLSTAEKVSKILVNATSTSDVEVINIKALNGSLQRDLTKQYFQNAPDNKAVNDGIDVGNKLLLINVDMSNVSNYTFDKFKLNGNGTGDWSEAANQIIVNPYKKQNGKIVPYENNLTCDIMSGVTIAPKANVTLTGSYSGTVIANQIIKKCELHKITVRKYLSKQGDFTIKNKSSEPEVTQITAQKVWKNDNESKRWGSINFDLMRNGSKVTHVTVSAKTDWKYTWTNLPIYDSNGKKYTYTVMEWHRCSDGVWRSLELNGDAIEGYKLVGYKDSNGVITLTNEAIEETKVTVEKTWNDGDGSGRWEYVNIDLVRNGTVYITKVLTKADCATDGKWKYTFEKLPKKDASGNEYKYTVNEWYGGAACNNYRRLKRGGAIIDGYQQTVYSESAVEGGKLIEITNTATGNMQIEIKKSWNVPSGTVLPKESEVEIDLYRYVDYPSDATVEHIKDKPTIKKDGNTWTYTWDNLDIRDKNGKKYVYQAKEVKIPDGYESSTGTIDNVYWNINVSDGSGVIVNTLKKTIKVEKKWVGDNEDVRWDSIHLELRRVEPDDTNTDTWVTSVVLNKDNGWKYEFTDLPACAPDGTEYKYYVKEWHGNAAGNWQALEKTGDKFDGYTLTYDDSSEVGRYVVQNITLTNSTTMVTIKKVWKNSDGSAITDTSALMPVHIALYRDASKSADANEHDKLIDKFTLSAENNWQVTVKGLEKNYSLNGKDSYGYTYSIKEVYEKSSNEWVPVKTNVKYSYIGGNDKCIRIADDKPEFVMICENTRSDYVLPATGGIGTTPIRSLGMGIMIVAIMGIAGVFFGNKKYHG